ncbi:TPA: hypothetical protein ACOECQ_002762 [Stenotrophomonas maltophilia]
MNSPSLERFVNAIASDLEEGGFREVTGTRLRRNLTTAVEAALPMLSEQANGTELLATASPALQADRAQFDAWMKSAGCYSSYGFNRIENMWEAWQAAQSVATVPQGCDACDRTGIRQNDEGRNIFCPDCDLGRACEGLGPRQQVGQPIGEIVYSGEGGLQIEFYDGKPLAPMKLYAGPAAQAMVLERYDAGLLSDVGGGDTAWWLDYLRSELARAHDHYQHQVNPAKEAGHG